MKTQPKRRATGAKRGARTLAYPVEFRLRIVKLYQEEGYSPKLLVEQFGISTHSIQRWVKAFRFHGAAGLEPKRLRQPEEQGSRGGSAASGGRESGAPRVRSPADQRCAEALFSDAHKSLHGSQDTCREGPGEKGPCQAGEEPAETALLRAGPAEPALAVGHTYYPTRGHNAYLIGFIDDYSRYITSLGLYRSQTAEHVLETYRRGLGEYEAPDWLAVGW